MSPSRPLGPIGWLLVTAGGLGHLRPASGTWGSTPPVLLVAGLLLLLGGDGLGPRDRIVIEVALGLTAVIATVACLAWGGRAELRWGRKDPSQVVVDEVAGQSIALLALPWTPLDDPHGWRDFAVIAGTAFVLFRVLDILKPPPARGLQRLPRGTGIVVDDIIAGAYAFVATQLLVRIVWEGTVL